MADKKQPPIPKTKGSPFILVVLLLVSAVIISLPTVLLLFFGMLPSIVAFIVERTKPRYAAICVSAMNFSGVLPYLLDSWAGDHTVSEAMNMLTNVFSLMVMYSSSAFGWLIFIAVPPVVATFLAVINERRIAQLRKRQREIIAEWGIGVAGEKPEKTPAAKPVETAAAAS
ncbi:MAG TPA: acyl-CoA synthetase [Alphaproteobacteria bacterium]|nr:acyl-CoA synthetase [Alphaproteobacteria bacterium]